MISISRFMTAAIAPILFALGAHAETAPATPSESEEKVVTLLSNKADDESAFEFSYAAPGSPVLPLLGVTGDQITRSESLRKFGFAVLNGFGGKGADQAIAFDFSPHWVLSPQTLSLEEYRSSGNAMGRLAARTKVGLAVSFGDKTAGRPSSMVSSISTSLLDSHDALFNSTFTKCIRGEAMSAIMMQIAAQPDDDADASGVDLFRAELAKFENGQPGLIERPSATQFASGSSRQFRRRTVSALGFASGTS